MVPPDAGSRILFFSGGTALAPVAAELSRHSEIQRNIVRGIFGGGVLGVCWGAAGHVGNGRGAALGCDKAGQIGGGLLGHLDGFLLYGFLLCVHAFLHERQ